MPKLLAFLPCSKVSIEEGTKNVTVDSIMETINVIVPQGVPPPPPNTVIQMNWAIYQLWERDEGETGRFESKAVLSEPAGSQFMETGVSPWEWTADSPRRHQTIAKVDAFPIWIPGPWQLKLLLKTQASQVFNEIVSIRIILKHHEQVP